MPTWLSKISQVVASCQQGTKTVWTNHGTKIVGAGITLVGVLVGLDHEILHSIGEFLGPHWGPRVLYGITTCGGLVTAYRGMQNQQTTQQILALQTQLQLQQLQHQATLLQLQQAQSPK